MSTPPLLTRIGILVLGLLAVCSAPASEPAASGEGEIELGRRIYEQGILPDGSLLRAVRPEGFVLEGEFAACVTCHRPSGMGSIEGSVDRTTLVPPVTGPVLFAPARFHGIDFNPTHHWVPNAAWERALTRGAYDEASLARALREGLDPDGRHLVAPMPRYDLDEPAVGALAAYLRRLSTERAPGVEADTLHLATVVTSDVPAEQVEAILGVLQVWGASSRASGSEWNLHPWTLSGPADTWADQLQALYRERPVFAVLSGVGGAEWRPVHRFCEQNRIPCVLPVIEVAPDGDPSFYAVYFSPGVPLEARLLARYWSDEARAGKGAPERVVQVFADVTGKEAANALEAALGDLGVKSMLRRLRPTVPAAALDTVDADTTLVLWLRPPEIEQLVQAMPDGPGAGEVVVSALLAPPESTLLPPAWKARLTFVSLFDDLGVQGELAKLRLRRWLDRNGIPHGENLRPQADAYAACYLFAKALAEISGQEVRRPSVPLGREHVLEMLETLVDKYSDGTTQVDPDSHVALYGRMSLGPQQRMAVRGGALLRYASPDSDRLVPGSDRIVP